MKRIGFGLTACAAALLPASALAHPHVFVQPHMEVRASAGGLLESLRNVWRMDELFSASVVVDFDANGDGKLDSAELAAIGAQVRGSIAQWGFYTKVHKSGGDVAMRAPPALGVTYDQKRGQLVFDFTMTPDAPVDLGKGDVTFSNFDDTYFVAFDFESAKDFTLKGMAAACRGEKSAPTADEAAKSWMASIAAIPADADVPADGIKFSEALSTKYRVVCGKG